MKYIIAIIQPDRLEAVQKLLGEKQVNLLTVSQTMGHGRQMGITRVYRGRREAGDLLKKIKLEIAVNDDYLDSTVDAIKKGARTGEIGDGKIFIFNLEDCVRIRTGETGSVAIG
ncbi:MAG TPA: P-II family nitrogen regulator [bacterium]|nr:P-II family nitrogen regulator [bacterium]